MNTLKTFAQSPLSETFARGWLSASTDENPFLLTSNSSDVWLLGRWARERGIPATAAVHKSKGYTWKLEGHLIRVEGTRITVIQAPSQLQMI